MCIYIDIYIYIKQENCVNIIFFQIIKGKWSFFKKLKKQ